jgi:hypothetical protein
MWVLNKHFRNQQKPCQPKNTKRRFVTVVNGQEVAGLGLEGPAVKR